MKPKKSGGPWDSPPASGTSDRRILISAKDGAWPTTHTVRYGAYGVPRRKTARRPDGIEPFPHERQSALESQDLTQALTGPAVFAGMSYDLNSS